MDGDWSQPGPHLDLVNPVATCASPGTCSCGPTWTSPGSGCSGSHMGLPWTWFLWSPYGLTWITMTLIHIWASHGPVDSGPYLGIIGSWILSYIPGPHLDLVTVVPPGPHLDKVTCSHRDITWSWWLRSSYWHHGTWFLSSTSGPHLDLVIHLPLWASP